MAVDFDGAALDRTPERRVLAEREIGAVEMVVAEELVEQPA